MPARLRAHSIAVADPARAAHHVATAALSDAPRGRPLLVVTTRWGTHPGLRPSPWVLDGVASAIAEAGLRAEALHLGERGAADPITTQLTTAGVATAPAEGDGVTIRPPGSRRGLRIPRAFIGRSLCLVLPCVHHHHGRERESTWRGPIGTALVELVASWGDTGARDPVERAARCVAETFAHVSVVIDGSWWAPLAVGDEGAPLLLAPERALGLRLSSPITTDTALDARLADAWLGAQLGLPLRRRPNETPRVVGPAARTPWPKLPRSSAPSRPRARGLADQALGALWRRNDGPRTRRAALPPAVPGALARLWHEYERPARTP